MEEKELTCIVCPNGCNLKVTIDQDNFTVSGNRCKRGEVFAKQELTCPMRTISSTVRTAFKEAPVIPVRVSSEIPKDQIFQVMDEINKVYVKDHLGIGDKVITNVKGLNVDVIVTSNILKELEGK